MKIKKEIRDDHQALLEVEIEAERFESTKRRAAREISRRKKIPGYRPGKAPYNVVLRYMGEGAIVSQAMELLVDEVYPEVLDQEDIHPYGPGSLEEIPSLDPPQMKFLVPLAPEVQLGDYHSVRIPYEYEETSEEELNEALENMRQYYAIIEPAERPVEKGDLVTISISVDLVHADEGQNPVLLQDKIIPIVTWSEGDTEDERESEWPYPGFWKELIGLQAGDEKAVSYTYPEDHEDESVKGKEVAIRFVVIEIKSRTLPPLDDEFAQTVGDYENLEELRTDVHRLLNKQKKTNYDRAYQDEVLGKIVKQAHIAYPPQMLERQIDSIVNQLESTVIRQRNIDLETYLKLENLDMEGLRSKFTDDAKNIILQSLALFEITKLENIQTSADEIEAETLSRLEEMLPLMDPKRAKRFLHDKERFSSFVGNVAAGKINSLTLERLQAIASGQYTPEEGATAEDVQEGAAAEVEGTETPEEGETGKESEHGE
ncbi:MAG: trigger factor [Chloroflexota bacterium]